MVELPPDIAKIIEQAAKVDGSIDFGAETWAPLRNVADKAAAVPGVYAIGLFLGVEYDSAVSRIIYLGSTRNLRTRLLGHNACSHNCYIEMLKQRYAGGLVAVAIPMPGMPAEWLLAIEDAALAAFNERFGRYPICNMSTIESPLAPALAGLIRFSPCVGVPFPLTLDTLSFQLGCKSLGRLSERLPPEEGAPVRSRNATQVVIRLSQGPPPPECTPEGIETRHSESDEKNRIDTMSWVWQEHVASWSIEKMTAVVELCRSLTIPKKRTKSKVHTFAAPSRKIPRPITWGEVALIQGRTVAGCWFPNPKVWVKIVFDKELLGQAILDPLMYRGEDKSDLPQTRRRPSVWDNKQWLRCKRLSAESHVST
ncbi:MAG TPA: hypothetical protein VG826_20110 [Pirellulales bacterium]|nr:hypothetical protein [Pirellulales bacterium]